MTCASCESKETIPGIPLDKCDERTPLNPAARTTIETRNISNADGNFTDQERLISSLLPKQRSRQFSPSITNPQPLNHSTNVLLVFRLQGMQSMAVTNFILAVLCLVHVSINIGLIYINFTKQRSPDVAEDEDVLSDRLFHLLEFWGTFGFAVVTCVSLVVTPKSLFNIYDNPLVLKLNLFFNVVATFLPALLVTINLERFEVISHEVEYLNEITMSFIDLVLLWSLCRRETIVGTRRPSVKIDIRDTSTATSPDSNQSEGGAIVTSVTLAIAAVSVAVAQMLIYNGFGRTDDGDMVGEIPAHYCEFTFEIISGLITFWFCMDNKFEADREIGRILYGRHQDCNICSDQSVQFKQIYHEYERDVVVLQMETPNPQAQLCQQPTCR